MMLTKTGWMAGVAALAVGPLLAPFIIGQLVDRHFATQHVVAVCHLAGGMLMLLLFFIARGDLLPENTDLYLPILILGALYSTLYVPTMMLTNSLTFQHPKAREREFPPIRLWGTIGFIVPAWLVEGYFLSGLKGDELDQARSVILALAGIGGLIMGVYSLTLPHTPPSLEDKKKMALGKVLGLLRLRSFLILVLISFLIAVVHQFYFVWNSPYVEAILLQGGTDSAWAQRISSIGQIFEIVVMAFLGFSVKRFGFKITMLAGAAAYLLRCLIFAGAVMIDGAFPFVLTLVCCGQALHGFCFGCFIAAAFMFTDRVAPKDARGSMQTFYGTFVLGLGMFIGAYLSGQIGERFTTEAPSKTAAVPDSVVGSRGVLRFEDKQNKQYHDRDWPAIWLSGAAMAGVALLGFLVLFPKDRPADSSPGEPAEEEPNVEP
ncbi:MAG: MFS transporter [Planctomycetes bacterium]|nr:MFS transporter [Planctomycetota bacterium]